MPYNPRTTNSRKLSSPPGLSGKGKVFLSVNWMQEVGMLNRTYSYRERQSLPELWLLWPATTRTEKGCGEKHLYHSFLSFYNLLLLPSINWIQSEAEGKRAQVMYSVGAHSLEHNRHKNNRKKVQGEGESDKWRLINPPYILQLSIYSCPTKSKL